MPFQSQEPVHSLGPCPDSIVSLCPWAGELGFGGGDAGIPSSVLWV